LHGRLAAVGGFLCLSRGRWHHDACRSNLYAHCWSKAQTEQAVKMQEVWAPGRSALERKQRFPSPSRLLSPPLLTPPVIPSPWTCLSLSHSSPGSWHAFLFRDDPPSLPAYLSALTEKHRYDPSAAVWCTHRALHDVQLYIQDPAREHVGGNGQTSADAR
jgi:hypothetical protein